MGRTNLRSSLETKLSKILGDLSASEQEYEDLRDGRRRLIALREKIAKLRQVAEAAETVLKFEYPDCALASFDEALLTTEMESCKTRHGWSHYGSY